VLKQRVHRQTEELTVEKIKDRKRYIVTDTQGNLLHVKVHAANIHDTKMGSPVFEATLGLF
jgi:hypothetical protein